MRSALTFLMLVSVVAARSSDPTPLLKTDVQRFGYESFPRKMVRPVPLSVGFIDDRRIAIAWISPDATKGNRRKEPRFGDAAHIHVVVMDTSTGQKQVEQQWPTRFTYASPVLAGVTDGRFLTCADDTLRILSVSLDVVREKQLPTQSSCNPSFSGRTLLVVSSSEHVRQLSVMNTETFEVLSTWTEQRPVGAETFAVSDHWLLGYCGEPTELCVRRFHEGWHLLRVIGVETRITQQHRIPASFVNDEVLAIRGKVTTLATVDGAMLFQISHADKQLFGSPPVPSSNSNRFVIVEGRLRGIRSEPLDMYPFYTDDRATIYSVKDHRPGFSLKLQGTSPWTPWRMIHNVVALSPDGHSLALISDGVLEVYTIPAGSAEQH